MLCKLTQPIYIYPEADFEKILYRMLRFSMPLFYIYGPQCINNCQCQNFFAGDNFYLNGFDTVVEQTCVHSFPG